MTKEELGTFFLKLFKGEIRVVEQLLVSEVTVKIATINGRKGELNTANFRKGIIDYGHAMPAVASQGNTGRKLIETTEALFRRLFGSVTYRHYETHGISASRTILVPGNKQLSIGTSMEGISFHWETITEESNDVSVYIQLIYVEDNQEHKCKIPLILSTNASNSPMYGRYRFSDDVFDAIRQTDLELSKEQIDTLLDAFKM